MATHSKGARCGKKLRHLSREGAERHRVRMVQRFGAAPDAYDVYCCHHCGSWHVGHRAVRKRRR